MPEDDILPWASMRIARRDGSKTLIAKYDLADEEIINRYSWHLQQDATTAYAETTLYPQGRRGAHLRIYMHQLVLGTPGRINHANGNGLDNRRANLSIASQSQILAKRKPVGGRSKFKGVIWDDAAGRWMGRFRGKNLGRFDQEEDAARAFDDAAFEQWGHQAYFNFPDEVADWQWPPTQMRPNG